MQANQVLGAALLQDDRLIAYASKSLTATQQRYALIEQEMLAVVSECHWFHQYIYEEESVGAITSSSYGDRKDQMESKSNNVLATNQSANRKYGKEVQHLSTKSEQTATSTNENKHPFQMVGSDLLNWNGQDFLLVFDYYSRYWDIEKL